MNSPVKLGPPALTALAVGMCATALLSPGLAWLDAGDFVTASATLGVPHPTGFPLHTLGGNLAMLLPLGNLASRLSFLSAACAALAAFCAISALGLQSFFRAWPAVFACILAFLSVPTLAIHSRVPEVYGLHLALVCAGAFCLERLWSTGQERFLLLLGLICGLGLSNHALFRGCAPVLALAALWTPNVRRPGPWIPALGMLLVGCALYLYLPASASRSGVHNWGDPSSWERFWIHVNASEIRASFDGARPSWGPEILLELRVFIRPFWSGLGAMGIIGLVGLMAACAQAVKALIQKSSAGHATKLGTVFLVLVTGEVVYSVLVNPMGNRDLQNGQLLGLVLPLSAAVFLQFVLERGSRILGRGPLKSYSGLAASAAVIALMAPGLDTNSLQTSRDFSCEDLAVASLALAEPDAMTVLVSDSMAACHLYLQHALAARPDMAVFERNQLGSKIRGPYALSHLPYPVVAPAEIHRWSRAPYPLREADFQTRCREIAAQNADRRAIYWEVSSTGDDLSTPEYELDSLWPISRLRKAKEAPPLNGQRRWEPSTGDASWGRAARGMGSQAYRSHAAQQWSYMGRKAFEKGEFSEAGRLFSLAAGLHPHSSAALVNVAVCLASLGQKKQALDLALTALEMAPRSRIALSNAWMYAQALGDSPTMKFLSKRASQLGVVLSSPGS
jgi:hypothetical protein